MINEHRCVCFCSSVSFSHAQLLVHQSAFMEFVQFYRDSVVGAGIEYDINTPAFIALKHNVLERLTVAGVREISTRLQV